jgi:hypothetical protein
MYVDLFLVTFFIKLQNTLQLYSRIYSKVAIIKRAKFILNKA